MRLVLFDDYHVAVVRGEEVVDVSHPFEDRLAPFPCTFMLSAIAGFDHLRPKLEAAAASGAGPARGSGTAQLCA